MTLLSWLIIFIPLVLIFFMAFYSKRYVRDVADYLASGRVAGRYVISVGDLTAGLSVITLVALCEQNYLTGMAMTFWNQLLVPLGIFISLSGYCIYRFRQTRCLSAGQFFELRYSRKFRIVAAIIRALAEMITNAIGPAVAVRFFIYFLGIPHQFTFLGMTISTYGIMVGLLLIMALAIIWPAGRISLLITDCFQGIISYPIFVIFTVFILTNISWGQDVVPVMLDRPAGESFINPMDIDNLRDFNLFALLVTLIGTVLNKAAWIGNDTTGSGRTPHEQKMASILGTWRNGFAQTMMALLGVFVVTFMLHNRFADQSHQVRIELSNKVAQEVFVSADLKENLRLKFNELQAPKHIIGVDKAYSREHNPDVAFFNQTLETLEHSKEELPTSKFQEFRSLYTQMMMPVMMKNLLPPVLMGFFALLMIMLLLSTDDSRIFNASSSIIQDVILPLRKKPLSLKEHLWSLKICSVCVAIFFFVISIFFAQLDYINMFITLMCAVWLGAAGPIMVGGLYTKFGTTCGAWCAIIFGSGSAILGLILQRNWAAHIYPWLEQNNYVANVGEILANISSPFSPYIIWTMDPAKFPINSMEIYFISMILGIISYTIGSFVTCQEPYNLDKLFHRGIYSDEPIAIVKKQKLTFSSVIRNLVGINNEYTTGDKVIAWSVFLWAVVYGFGIMFCGVLIWNTISPWSHERWGIYFFISTVATALIVGTISTVWFMIGGVMDSFALFRDLKKRITNPLDDGWVYEDTKIIKNDSKDL